MLFIFISLISCSDDTLSSLYMIWKGNWSISHNRFVDQELNKDSVVHVNDYWGIITKDSITDFPINIYESPNNTEVPIFNFSTHFRNNYIQVKKEDEVYTYYPYVISEAHFSISGKFKEYNFHFIYAGRDRYQLSVFNFKNHEWNYFDIIKDVDRHDPTWFEENFWLMFGYISISILMFILYNYAFKQYTKLADETDKRIRKEEKLPNPEFEDALAPGHVRKRTTNIYSEGNK